MPGVLPAQKCWILTLVLMAGALGCPSRMYAESVGSPSSILKKGQWIFGVGGGSLLGGRMKGGAEAAVYHVGHFRGYGLTDRLSLYGKIGGVYLEVDDSSIKKANNPSSTNSFRGNVLLSGQLKAKFWESITTGWEWDGSLQYVEIRARHRGRNEIRWHEWDVATSVAKSFGRVKPYVGVKYSLVRAFFHVRQNGNVLKEGHYTPKVPVGPFLGTDVYFGEHEDVIINVETSYVSGGEVNLAVSYVF